jgi:hypothetical protein
MKMFDKLNRRMVLMVEFSQDSDCGCGNHKMRGLSKEATTQLCSQAYLQKCNGSPAADRGVHPHALAQELA